MDKDDAFTLSPLAEFDLHDHLTSELMLSTVLKDCGGGAVVEEEDGCIVIESEGGCSAANAVEFVKGSLFQPVPYSPSTPWGMPSDIERKYHLREGYAIVNVPPTIMFKAKIFKPSRLCCVYKINGMGAGERERIRRERERVYGGGEGAAVTTVSDGEEGDVWDGVGEQINSVWREKIDDEGIRKEEEDFNFDDYMV